MGFIKDWFVARLQKEHLKLVDECEMKARHLLTHFELANQILPDPETARNEAFFREFLVLAGEARADLRAGKRLPQDDIDQLFVFHRRFDEVKAAMMEAERRAKARFEGN